MLCTGLERDLEKGLEKAGKELSNNCESWGAISGREVGQGIKYGKRCLYDQVTEYTYQLVYRTSLLWCIISTGPCDAISCKKHQTEEP